MKDFPICYAKHKKHCVQKLIFSFHIYIPFYFTLLLLRRLKWKGICLFSQKSISQGWVSAYLNSHISHIMIITSMVTTHDITNTMHQQKQERSWDMAWSKPSLWPKDAKAEAKWFCVGILAEK